VREAIRLGATRLNASPMTFILQKLGTRPLCARPPLRIQGRTPDC
jgi:hypothetical protein